MLVDWFVELDVNLWVACSNLMAFGWDLNSREFLGLTVLSWARQEGLLGAMSSATGSCAVKNVQRFSIWDFISKAH